MRKLILFFILILNYSVFSQLRLGLRTGINFSDYTNIDSKKRTNFYVGTILPINLSGIYTLQPELNYSKQGATITLKDNSKYNLFSDYIIVSTINKFNVFNKLNFLFGPYTAIRTNEKVSRSYSTASLFSFTITKNLYEPIELGLIIGLEYNFNKLLSIETRYINSSADALDLDYFDENYNNDDEKTQVFQFGITYKFDLKDNNK